MDTYFRETYCKFNFIRNIAENLVQILLNHQYFITLITSIVTLRQFEKCILQWSLKL